MKGSFAFLVLLSACSSSTVNVDSGSDGGFAWCGIPMSCDPVNNTGCGPGQTCILEPTTSRSTRCIAPGTLPRGVGCGFDDCQPGLVCIGRGGAGGCTQLCCGIGDDAPCRNPATGGTPDSRCEDLFLDGTIFYCTTL